MKQRQWSFVWVVPEHKTMTSRRKPLGGRFWFIIKINFVKARTSQFWSHEVPSPENVQEPDWPPRGHCGDNAYIEMRNYVRHFQSISGMISVSGSSLQIISQNVLSSLHFYLNGSIVTSQLYLMETEKKMWWDRNYSWDRLLWSYFCKLYRQRCGVVQFIWPRFIREIGGIT